MKGKVKSIVSLALLAGSLVLVSGQEGKAAELPLGGNEGMVSVCSLYSKSSTTSLVIKEKSATIIGLVNGVSGTTTKIHAKLTLQKYSGGSWSAVKSYETTVTTTNCMLKKVKAVSAGKYRVKGVYTVYHGAKSEKITQYSNSVSC